MPFGLSSRRTFGAACAFLGLVVMMTSQRPSLSVIGIGMCALAIFCLTWLVGGAAPKPSVPSPAPARGDDRVPSLDEVVAEAHRIRTGGVGARTHPALDTAVRTPAPTPGR
jgi:hypothetical protein